MLGCIVWRLITDDRGNWICFACNVPRMVEKTSFFVHAMMTYNIGRPLQSRWNPVYDPVNLGPSVGLLCFSLCMMLITHSVWNISFSGVCGHSSHMLPWCAITIKTHDLFSSRGCTSAHNIGIFHVFCCHTICMTPSILNIAQLHKCMQYEKHAPSQIVPYLSRFW